MRVLYVDDDRINTLLFTETCRIAPWIEIECAGSGAEALALAAGFAPEVLVIDLHLPDTSGYALLQRLRGDAGCADVPAFLCTADSPAEVGREAMAAGFQGCWTKPVDLPSMLADLERFGRAPGGAA